MYEETVCTYCIHTPHSSKPFSPRNNTFTFSRRSSKVTCHGSYTRSHSDGGVDNAGRQPARRELLGFGVLLRDTSTVSRQEPGNKHATATRSTS